MSVLGFVPEANSLFSPLGHDLLHLLLLFFGTQVFIIFQFLLHPLPLLYPVIQLALDLRYAFPLHFLVKHKASLFPHLSESALRLLRIQLFQVLLLHWLQLLFTSHSQLFQFYCYSQCQRVLIIWWEMCDPCLVMVLLTEVHMILLSVDLYDWQPLVHVFLYTHVVGLPQGFLLLDSWLWFGCLSCWLLKLQYVTVEAGRNLQIVLLEAVKELLHLRGHAIVDNISLDN